MYHVILAGGRGERFWPLSTEEKPKQFLNIIDNTSLIKSTYMRLLKISSQKNIFIITSKKYVKIIQKQISDIKIDNIIMEPSPKNTAPAIYLATSYIYSLDKNASIGVYPSDHYIKNEKNFVKTINKIDKFLNKRTDSIVTIGIEPFFPSTSYGYIEKAINSNNDFSKINSFIEKPNINKAKKLIAKKNILWNSGMFFYNSKFMIDEIKNYIPKLKKIFNSYPINIKNMSETLNVSWEKINSQSIDKAVLEKTKNSLCIKSDFSWSDVGTWKALFELLPKDEAKNALIGTYKQHDANNNLVISKDKLTCLVGVENLAIINTDSITLVVDLSKSDEIKHLIKKISQK